MQEVTLPMKKARAAKPSARAFELAETQRNAAETTKKASSANIVALQGANTWS